MREDEYCEKPTEGKWFKVNPEAINREFFQNERADIKQEKTRRLILEAFFEWENKPEKYARMFETLIPKLRIF